MIPYDVIVIGLSRAGAAVADAAAAAGLKVAAVRASAADEISDRLSYALEDAALPPPGPVRFDLLEGPASFLDRGRLSAGGREVAARRYVVAVGAVPRLPDGFPGVPFTTPLEALTECATRPINGVVLGAGPVAAVVADRLRKAGGRVTIAARSPRLLAREDESVSAALSERLRARGVAINTGITGLSIAPLADGFHARFCCGGDNREAQADRVIAATGLAPALEGLGLDRAGIFTREDRIVTNDEMRTSNPRVFAVGHAADPGASLAAQEFQCDVAAANLTAPFWARRRIEPGETPFALRTTPPVARVGFTEAQARERHRDVVVSASSFFESPGNADAPGLIKLVGRRRGGRLLGAHMVGAGAGELVLFFDLLVRAELSLHDVPHRRHFPLPGPTDAAYTALTAWSAAAE